MTQIFIEDKNKINPTGCKYRTQEISGLVKYKPSCPESKTKFVIFSLPNKPNSNVTILLNKKKKNVKYL